ncbi:MAG: acetoin utilization protein AcuC, partial [Deltaproteobacteria bacterium]|nr:acetoin utilization protein AcuC [Deltaproteobacteria bacterium]
MSVAFAYSERFSRFDYGPDHPLRIERLDLTVALMEEYGLLEH